MFFPKKKWSNGDKDQFNGDSKFAKTIGLNNNVTK